MIMDTFNIFFLSISFFVFGLSVYGIIKYEFSNNRFYFSIVGSLIGIILLIASFTCINKLNYEKKHGYDIYTLRLYYLGGSQEVRTFKISSWDWPVIHSSRGSYWLNIGKFHIDGVVRFETISIVNEPFNK